MLWQACPAANPKGNLLFTHSQFDFQSINQSTNLWFLSLDPNKGIH